MVENLCKMNQLTEATLSWYIELTKIDSSASTSWTMMLLIKTFTLIMSLQNGTSEETGLEPAQSNWLSPGRGESTGWPISWRTGFSWLRFGMFHHPAWALGKHSSGPQVKELPKSKSTQPRFARRWATLFWMKILTVRCAATSSIFSSPGIIRN